MQPAHETAPVPAPLGLQAGPNSRNRVVPKREILHVIIDGQIESERYRHLIKERGEVSLLVPDAIAELYLQLHRQPRGAWSHEIDVRPWAEKFWVAASSTGRYDYPGERSVLSIAVGGESLKASNPSISGEHPNNGTPSFRKVLRNSTPRESANVKPCRSRHIRSETRAVVTTFRASSTHAPSSFPWKLIDKRVIGTGSVMSSNACTPDLFSFRHGG